jgi:hypothetical protein
VTLLPRALIVPSTVGSSNASPSAKRTIAILCHPGQRRRMSRYAINDFAAVWREDGHDVVFVFGTADPVPADLVIVHVDLTIVPDEYFEFATAYPTVLNGKVRDIRKSTFSSLRVVPGDPYAGKVIVKTNLNYAGLPEVLLGETRYDPANMKFRSPEDYQIYDSIDEVPPSTWEERDVIVEKFVPEMEDGLYVMRAMNFLGDRASCGKVLSRHPIVNGKTHVRIERVPPDPAMVALREQMGFDYGKFDYVMHEGRPILLDANKTAGTGNVPMTPERAKTRRWRAEGLYAYFDRQL